MSCCIDLQGNSKLFHDSLHLSLPIFSLSVALPIHVLPWQLFDVVTQHPIICKDRDVREPVKLLHTHTHTPGGRCDRIIGEGVRKEILQGWKMKWWLREGGTGKRYTGVGWRGCGGGWDQHNITSQNYPINSPTVAETWTNSAHRDRAVWKEHRISDRLWLAGFS